MANAPKESASLFTALISATVTACAIAYVTHFEWHFSRVEVRRDALVLAALMAVALGVKLLLRGRKNGT